MDNKVKPKRLAFVIGCDSYESEEISNLKFANKDARELYKLLIDPDIGNFRPEEEALLIENPVSYEISKKLFNALQNLGKHDSILIYYSGHGLKNQYGDLYLATTDSDPHNALDVCTISGKTLRDYMSNSRSNKICMMLDCCYSGAFGDKGTAATSAMDVSQDVEKNLSGEGRVILMSAHRSQRAKENDDHGHGVFTHFLLEGLRNGSADENGDGSITPVELHKYIRNRMSEAGGVAQEPHINVTGTGGDFELVASKAQREQWESDIELEVDKFMQAKDHCNAIEFLNVKLDTTKAGAQQKYIQTQIDKVENDQETLREEFKNGILEHQKNGDLNAQLTNEILACITRNPDFLFQQQGLNDCEEIIRALFIQDVTTAYLSKTWDEFKANLERTLPPPYIPKHKPKPPETAAGDVPPIEKPKPQPSTMPAKVYAWWKAHVWVQWLAISVILLVSAVIVINFLIKDPYDPTKLRVGLLVKNKEGHSVESTTEITSLFAGKLNSLLQEEAKKNDMTSNYRFVTDNLLIKHKATDLESAIAHNQVEIVGELSPYLVFSMRNKYGAEPLISPKYNNKDKYTSIIFARKDAPFIELQDNDKFDRDDAFVSMINLLVSEQGNKLLVVADTSSTSGYWFPRREVLKNIKNAEVSFSEVTDVSDNRDIINNVCTQGNDMIAGALAAFRICENYDQNPQCPQLKRCPDGSELVMIKEVIDIPQGAYVANKKFYNDLKKNQMLPLFHRAWQKAARELLDESISAHVINGETVIIDAQKRELINTYIQHKWREIDDYDLYYASAESAFTFEDTKALKSSKNQRLTLIAAFIILLVCATLYLLIKRSESTNRAHVT